MSNPLPRFAILYPISPIPMIPIVDPETSTPIMLSGRCVVLGSMHIRWPEEEKQQR